MPTNLDIYRSAKLLIDQHGQDALIEVAVKWDELLDAGDLDGQQTWLKIRAAVLELLKPDELPLRPAFPARVAEDLASRRVGRPHTGATMAGLIAKVIRAKSAAS